ncbi:major facilitator superfamily transporter [Colletotrichum scovillei]|uniref:Major facilitator superfamily transporter n=1 Tax=Colletotrichum scovillei TaxID=1209932 RepID=A0A9P7U9B2_9PEZI|nr:major facilitator superfamily transporter [Colletotrichum scovillei]KAF4780714.1 major facilitator superfamily transporter [Colletotrichum scovillei]KAG7045238.1 major facilitator superfamily transporter [Colletotrichum scovillei]KAG7052400.1 major facilitator superfamily transporter [Colletotrichum scovillei]KAG7064694.1 major facilitator superfamily transporter [Colletotrichum scovillei]
MSSVDEKHAPEPAAAADVEPVTAAPTTTAIDGPVPRPAGFMYRGFRIGGKELWYASPRIQLFMVSFVCFLCPGMFNALGGLGGGGQVSTKASNDANTALYSTFAVAAFFAGTFANRLGLRLTLSLGGLGYCIYAASFLSYSHNQNEGFVIFAGAFLGVCAGLLWTGQGAIMMSYPSEKEKGRYISWFWMIFNLGAVIGALIPLGQNINTTSRSTVTDGTYAAFIVLMLLGAILALFMCDVPKIIREDGSKVIVMKNPSWQSEFKGLWETLAQDPWIILLFPMFFTSNVFYTYQTNDMNAPHFNTRTRSLNNLLYWSSQIIGALIFGYALDFPKVRRSVRAKASYITLFVLTMAIWGGGYAWQKKQAPRGEIEGNLDYPTIDWTDGGEAYIGPMFLYMFYGFFDACWQTSIYWYMGALSNSSRKAANLAGFYKGIQSAGAAVFWRLDGVQTEYNTIFGATWGCLAGALVIGAPIIFLKIKDTVTVEEDLKFSDETIADVAAPGTVDTKLEKEVA